MPWPWRRVQGRLPVQRPLHAGETAEAIAADDLQGVYPQYQRAVESLPAIIDAPRHTVSVAFDRYLPPRIAAWRPWLGCAQLPIRADPPGSRPSAEARRPRCAGRRRLAVAAGRGGPRGPATLRSSGRGARRRDRRASTTRPMGREQRPRRCRLRRAAHPGRALPAGLGCGSPATHMVGGEEPDRQPDRPRRFKGWSRSTRRPTFPSGGHLAIPAPRSPWPISCTWPAACGRTARQPHR